MRKSSLCVALLVMMSIGCSDDSSSINNVTSNNTTNNVANNSSNNASNNTTNNATNNVAVNNIPALTNAQIFALGEPYSKLILEVDYIEGFAPSDIDADMVAHLSKVVDKPDGIQIVRDQAIASPSADHIWTFEEIKTLFAAQNSLELNANETKIHVIFVDGGYTGDTAESSILGLAWGTNVVMFEQNLLNSCAKPILNGRLCGFTEQAILLHEIGHVIGLVNNGAPLTADHQDPDHGHHCSNPDCLMYWSYEGTALVEALRGKLDENEEATIFEFDADCMNDLAAIE